MEIFESALDPIQKELDKEIFIDGKDVIKEKVKHFIIDTFIRWLIKMGHKETELGKITLLGSGIGYQYTKTSDIDVNVELSVSPEEEEKLIPLLPNGNILPGTNHPVNYFFVKDADRAIKQSDNAYDLRKDIWIKRATKEKTNVPASYLLEIAKFFMAGIQSGLEEFERDKVDLETLNSYTDEMEDYDKEEIDKLKEEKKAEILADLDGLKVGRHIIRSFRHEPFEDEEFEPMELSIEISIKKPNLSINNLLYKTLEKYGYIDKLNKAMEEREKYLAQ